MKLTINSKTILEKVLEVGACINSGHHMPILQCIKLDVAKDGLEFTATDLETTARAWITGGHTASGEMGTCIPFKMFLSILKSLPDAPVDMEFKGNNLNLVCGQSVYDIPLDKVDEFPKEEAVEWEPGFDIPTDDLVTSIKNALKFNDPADDLGPFSSIRIYSRDGIAKIAGFCYHKLYQRELFETDGQFDLLLSTNTANFLASGIIKEDNIKVSHTDNRIRFEGESYSIITLRPNKNLPDQEVLIKKNMHDGGLAVMDKKEFTSKLNRLINPSMLVYPVVKMTFGPKELRMELNNDFFNYKGKEVVKSDRDGEAVTINLNANQVLNAVSVVSEEVLKLAVAGPKQACFIRTQKTDILISPYGSSS